MSRLQLPNELWIHVFEEISRPSDLSAIVRTCKTFHDLAFRRLHSRIFWTNPFHPVHALKFWRAMKAVDASCVEAPRYLEIGVSRMCVSLHPNIVGVDGMVTSKNRSHPRSFAESSDIFSALVLYSGETACDFNIDFFASGALHYSMMTRASTFINLEELAFTQVILPDSFHTFIYSFPKLRKLRLEVCVLPAAGAPAPSHASLPITELWLRGLYYAVEMRHQNIEPMALRNPIEFFSLASAQSLVTLHLDSTAPVFSIFGNYGSPPVPVNLRHIFLHRNRPTKYDRSWRPSDIGFEGSRRGYDNSSLMLSMAAFLSLCPSIESISTCYAFSETHFTTQLLSPQYFDSSHLRNYSGPIASFHFNSFSMARSLQAIDVTDDRGILLSMIPKFGDEMTDLRVLSVRLGGWDNEIIYAICSLLPLLVRLKIVYSGRAPDDNFIISLGPHLLSRLSRLHTFQFYEVSGNSPLLTEEGGGESEVELKALILPWKNYCPSLREVQLVDGYLWRRASGGDTWFRRLLPTDGVPEDIWNPCVM